MQNYLLDIQDFDGNSIQRDYEDYPKYLELEQIFKIKFSPDYCSTGILVSFFHNGEKTGYRYVNAEQLPFNFPKWFLSKIEAMNASYDWFTDAGNHEADYGKKYTIDSENFFVDVVDMIGKDFIKLFPEHAGLLNPHMNDHEDDYE